jgi:GNAT superfamily N-acetyltransferase
VSNQLSGQPPDRPSQAVTRAHIGRRVTVRRVVGERDGRPLSSDVVGELVAISNDLFVVRRRDGTVIDITRDAVTHARVVAEGGRPRRAIEWSEIELERVAASGWRALETERLGDWLLRASLGFTGRGNSLLPLGNPGLPLSEAADFVEEWYAARGLPARAQIPTVACADVDELLANKGWAAADETMVMVADVRPVLAANAVREDLPHVAVEDVPSAAWLSTYHYRGGDLPPHAVHMMSLHDKAGFASVADSGGVLAIVRGAIDEGWLGLTAVETVDRARRQGLARHAVLGTVAWAAKRGARHVYLQVADHNSAAIAMYEGLGFVEHHRYRYRQRG